jgi:hypothetical protein
MASRLAAPVTLSEPVLAPAPGGLRLTRTDLVGEPAAGALALGNGRSGDEKRPLLEEHGTSGRPWSYTA